MKFIEHFLMIFGLLLFNCLMTIAVVENNKSEVIYCMAVIVLIIIGTLLGW